MLRRNQSFETIIELLEYSGRKITESLGDITAIGEKRWKE
jgi:hypothetical protein